MSIYRIPLLFTVAVCIHQCFTPPQPPPDKGEGISPQTAVERLSMSIMSRRGPDVLTLMKLGGWLPTLIETAVVLAKLDILPGPLNAKVLRYLTGSTSQVAVSLPPIMLLGTTVAVAGTALRTSAFRALGRHFTFELSLKKDHTLVTTFPYNIVRHPSYIGGWIAIAGLGLTHTTRDGWVRAVLIPRGSGMDSTLEKATCGAIAAAFTLMLAMSFSRISVEDAMLRARFGQEWENWARHVPYRLVPYIW